MSATLCKWSQVQGKSHVSLHRERGGLKAIVLFAAGCAGGSITFPFCPLGKAV